MAVVGVPPRSSISNDLKNTMHNDRQMVGGVEASVASWPSRRLRAGIMCRRKYALLLVNERRCQNKIVYMRKHG